MATYVPGAFRMADEAVLRQFIAHHGFALLVTADDAEPFVTHLPLVMDEERGRLLGHVAKANRHWRLFDGERVSIAIFSGPHAYVSPSWYSTQPAVPTWNYAAVHVTGRPRVIDDPIEVEDALRRLINKYEAGSPEPWAYELPADYHAKMLQGIVAFSMPIERMEGKFKLSQNRSIEDRRLVIARLCGGGSEARGVADLMVRHVLS